MLRKTLAIATLSLVCLTCLAPLTHAEEEVITDLENILSGDSDTEVLPTELTPAPVETDIEAETIIEEMVEVEEVEVEMVVDEPEIPDADMTVDESTELEVVEVESEMMMDEAMDEALNEWMDGSVDGQA